MSFIYWLFRRKNYEIKIVLATLAVLISLPIISVVVFASSGLALVGSALANLNPVTHLVEIFEPNGHKVAEVKLSTVWPAQGYISDEFGAHEAFRLELGLGPHTGIDIADNRGKISGDPITPFMEGKVIAVHDKDDNTCGKHVELQHQYNITSLYCHMSEPQAIVEEDVKPGDVIGLSGQTGVATGPHVHFQVMVYGIAVNPRIFMVGDPEPY